MTLRFTITGPPRTKKTHNQVFPMISTEAIGNMIADLRKIPAGTGYHRAAVRVLMTHINFSVQPSEGFTEWSKLAYLQGGGIRTSLAEAGVKLPIMGPVCLTAKIYRDADRGDLLGYLDAIADALQATQYKCGACRKKSLVLGNCPHCKGPVFGMSVSREGLGIIGDDAQIKALEDNELLKDAARPRVELTIHTLAAAQGGLFE